MHLPEEMDGFISALRLFCRLDYDIMQRIAQESLWWRK